MEEFKLEYSISSSDTDTNVSWIPAHSTNSENPTIFKTGLNSNNYNNQKDQLPVIYLKASVEARRIRIIPQVNGNKEIAMRVDTDNELYDILSNYSGNIYLDINTGLIPDISTINLTTSDPNGDYNILSLTEDELGRNGHISYKFTYNRNKTYKLMINKIIGTQTYSKITLKYEMSSEVDLTNKKPTDSYVKLADNTNVNQLTYDNSNNGLFEFTPDETFKFPSNLSTQFKEVFIRSKWYYLISFIGKRTNQII